MSCDRCGFDCFCERSQPTIWLGSIEPSKQTLSDWLNANTRSFSEWALKTYKDGKDEPSPLALLIAKTMGK